MKIKNFIKNILKSNIGNICANIIMNFLPAGFVFWMTKNGNRMVTQNNEYLLFRV